MSQERIDPPLTGIIATVLGLSAITFWIIQYLIKIDEAIIISVICPCIIFGIILGISSAPDDKAQGVHGFTKLGLAINLGFICYLILSPFLIALIQFLIGL